MSITKISEEQINFFLNGRDPQTGIIAIECGYNDSEVSIIYRQFPTLEKRIKTASFEPFLWAKISGSRKLFVDKNTKEQDKRLLKKKMDEYCISAKGLNIYSEEGKTTERLENGYRVLFTATKKMSYNRFLQFFKEGGVDIFDDSKDFIQVSPVEQYMMRSGKRMFKGFEDYNDLTRLEFDLETQGLNPEIHRIDQIGIRTNKGFEFIIPIEDAETKRQKDRNELDGIKLYFSIIKEIKPDVITGHNSENFDWNFIIKRCEMLGTSIKEVSGEYFKTPLYKKQRKTVLKLGGEVEYFNQTVLWGHNITDSLHAIRRAQAIDSNMKKADLKYVTKYSKLNKDNRIYVPGDQIKVLWTDKTNDYALNDNNGEWYKITEKYPLKDDFEIVTGRYVIERYLKDDLYETDKVELRYNQPNFLISKLLPTSFGRVCTMGTAGIWKLIMLSWSFEHNLAIPATAPTRQFTGGLSRLLQVGFAADVVKLDYNSLYPSINITWDILSEHDIMNVMLSLLEYVLTDREKNKYLKKLAKKESNKLKKELEFLKIDSKEYNDKLSEIKRYESEENLYDKKQIVLKILANSYFGSTGNPNLFNWSEINCAEKTTCIGRNSLRLMIKWFSERGYKPIVGDSFTSDTPVFIKYNDNNLIDIISIREIFNELDYEIDLLDREYDYSKKTYKVLSRSGWIEPSYIYRHKTNKNIHRVSDIDKSITDVTSDHSLFDENKKQIHSKDINENTKLEYYDKEIVIENELNSINELEAIKLGEDLGKFIIDRVPTNILNSNIETQKIFFNSFLKNNNGIELNLDNRNKVCLSGLFFIKNKITKNVNFLKL